MSDGVSRGGDADAAAAAGVAVEVDYVRLAIREAYHIRSPPANRYP